MKYSLSIGERANRAVSSVRMCGRKFRRAVAARARIFSRNSRLGQPLGVWRGQGLAPAGKYIPFWFVAPSVTSGQIAAPSTRAHLIYIMALMSLIWTLDCETLNDHKISHNRDWCGYEDTQGIPGVTSKEERTDAVFRLQLSTGITPNITTRSEREVSVMQQVELER